MYQHNVFATQHLYMHTCMYLSWQPLFCIGIWNPAGDVPIYPFSLEVGAYTMMHGYSDFSFQRFQHFSGLGRFRSYSTVCVSMLTELRDNLGRVGANIKKNFLESMRYTWQAVQQFAASHSGSTWQEQVSHGTAALPQIPR